MDSDSSAAAAEAVQLYLLGLEHISMHVIMSMATPGLKVPFLCRALTWNDVPRVDTDPKKTNKQTKVYMKIQQTLPRTSLKLLGLKLLNPH